MTTSTACKGRQRSCNQCGTTYRAPRATSRYCTASCRKQAHRGSAPTGALQGTLQCPVGRLLIKIGFAGPANHADRSLMLTVPRDHALAEVVAIFDVKGWGLLSEAEFDHALKANGIQTFSTYSSEAIDRNRRQTRERVRAERSLA